MDAFVELEDGTRITVYQYDDLMDKFEHRSLLSDGTKLTQEQYADLMAHKPVTVPGRRVSPTFGQ